MSKRKRFLVKSLGISKRLLVVALATLFLALASFFNAAPASAALMIDQETKDAVYAAKQNALGARNMAYDAFNAAKRAENAANNANNNAYNAYNRAKNVDENVVKLWDKVTDAQRKAEVAANNSNLIYNQIANNDDSLSNKLIHIESLLSNAYGTPGLTEGMKMAHRFFGITPVGTFKDVLEDLFKKYRGSGGSSSNPSMDGDSFIALSKQIEELTNLVKQNEKNAQFRQARVESFNDVVRYNNKQVNKQLESMSSSLKEISNAVSNLPSNPSNPDEVLQGLGALNETLNGQRGVIDRIASGISEAGKKLDEVSSAVRSSSMSKEGLSDVTARMSSIGELIKGGVAVQEAVKVLTGQLLTKMGEVAANAGKPLAYLEDLKNFAQKQGEALKKFLDSRKDFDDCIQLAQSVGFNITNSVHPCDRKEKFLKDLKDLGEQSGKNYSEYFQKQTENFKKLIGGVAQFASNHILKSNEIKDKLTDVQQAAEKAAQSAKDAGENVAGQIKAAKSEMSKGFKDLLSGINGLKNNNPAPVPGGNIDGFTGGKGLGDGSIGIGNGNMPRAAAWGRSISCIKTSLGTSGGCNGVGEIRLGSYLTVDPVKAACEKVPTDKVNIFKGIVGAVIILVACWACVRAINAGLSYHSGS